MHARVIPLQCKPDLLQDFLSVYHSAVMPPLIQESGFSGALMVSDPETRSGFMVSLWNSEEALQRSELNGRKALASMLLPFLTESAPLEHYEVMVQAGQHIGGQFARVITLPVPEKHLEPARTVYEEEYLPLLKRQPGFLGVMWLVNRSQGTGRGISFWASREQMQAADQEGEFFPKVLSRLAEYFSAPTEMGYYAIDAQM